MKRYPLWPAALAAALGLGCAGDAPPPAPAPTRVRPADPAALHLGGTGAMMPLLTRLSESWARRGGSPPVRIEDSIGSGGGVRAAADGVLDLGLVSRPLSDRERGLGLQEVPLGRDVVVLAAYPGVAADDISAAALLALHRGERRSFPDGTPAVLLLRDRGESANLALDEAVPGLQAAREDAYRERRLRVLYHDSAMAEALASTPGALGVFPLGAVRAFGLQLKVLRLGGVPPSPEAVAAGRWRASRELRVVARPERLRRAEGFLRFALSEEGRALYRDCGYLPPEAGAADGAGPAGRSSP